MSYTLLAKTEPVARKDHRCIWCYGSIAKGTKYLAERSVFNGEMQNHHWHPECWKACADESAGECEWEFTPGEGQRPSNGGNDEA